MIPLIPSRTRLLLWALAGLGAPLAPQFLLWHTTSNAWTDLHLILLALATGSSLMAGVLAVLARRRYSTAINTGLLMTAVSLAMLVAALVLDVTVRWKFWTATGFRAVRDEPVSFLVSAVALALLALSFEDRLAIQSRRRASSGERSRDVTLVTRWALLAYATVRIGTVLAAGKWDRFADPRWLGILLLAAAPAVLLFVPAMTRSAVTYMIIASVAMAGVALGLTSSVVLAPLPELALMAGMMAGGALLFARLAESKLLGRAPAGSEELAISTGRATYSAAFVLAGAFSIAFWPVPSGEAAGVESAPVRQARGGDIFWIDGNRNGYGTSFPHALHSELLGGKEACAQCHHANLPHDHNSACSSCHRDMYRASDTFRHSWHSSPDGARLACGECHSKGLPRSASTAKKCEACHQDLTPPGATLKVKQQHAAGYAMAMHRLCVDCHRTSGTAQCVHCHDKARPLVDDPELAARLARPAIPDRIVRLVTQAVK